MRVEILTAPDNGFVVGRDLVGYARVGSDPDVWSDLLPGSGELSAIRGGTTGRVNTLDVGTLTVPLKDADPTTDLRLRVGRHLRLYDEDRDEVLWYGRVADIPATDEGTYSVTTLVATDAVDSLANATRYGAGVYGVPETLRQRVERLASTATARINHVFRESSDPTPPVVDWTANVPGVGAIPVTPVGDGGSATQSAWWNPPNVWPNSGGLYVEFILPVDGWPFGVYEVTATVDVTVAVAGGGTHKEVARVNVAFINAAGNAAAVGLQTPAGVSPLAVVSGPIRRTPEFGRLLIAITAPNPTNDGSGVSTIALTGVTGRRIDGPNDLQAVAYEGPVSDHLNMACDSVGAVWRPTLGGAAEVIEGPIGGGAVAVFSDDRAVSPADASYTRLAFGYATADDLVNDLTVTNHGRTLEGDAADTTFTVTNPTSVAGHGRRSSSLDTCLAREADTLERARAVLDGLATPAWGPRSLTYRYGDLERTPDLYDMVTVWRRGTAHTCLVLGVAHQVRPDPERPHAPIAHLVTLTLGKATP